MTDEQQNKKRTKIERLEAWQKWVELINKIFIGLLLASITAILSFRTTLISDAIKSGEFEIKKIEFEHKLYNDLMFDTGQTKYNRQDVALAIIYDFYKEDASKKEFLLDMAYIITQDTSRKKSSLPFDILVRLDPEKGREMQYNLSKLQEGLRQDFMSVANLNDTDKMPVQIEIDNARFNNFEKINKFAPGKSTIFIQIKKGDLNKDAERIRQIMLNKGFLVPTIQIVEGSYSNSIRYFNAQDVTVAKDLSMTLKDSVKQLWDIDLYDLSKSVKLKAPVGQIELWISDFK